MEKVSFRPNTTGFIRSLIQRGLVTMSGLEDLDKTVAELMKKEVPPMLDRERNALLQKLGSLL